MLEHLQYPYALLALITLALLVWRPFAGLLLLVAIFPMDRWAPRLPVPGLNTETLLIAMAFAMTQLRFGGLLPPLRFSGPVLAFMSVIVLGWVIAIPWSYSMPTIHDELAIWRAFKSVKSMTFTALLFFIVYWWVRERDDRRRLLEAISFGVFLSGIGALLDMLFDINPTSGGEGRMSGLSGEPNELAACLGSMLFVSAYLALPSTGLPFARRVFHGGTALLAGVFVVLTLSRGNWIAMVPALAVFTFMVDRRVFLATAVAGVLVATVAFPLLPERVRDRVTSTTQSGQMVFRVAGAENFEGSTQSRIVFARIGYDMWRHSPIWGNGFMYFSFNTPKFGAKYGVLRTKDPHNIAVMFAADTGLIGLGTLGWLVLAVALCGRQLYRSNSEEWLLGAVLLGSATELLVVNLTGNSFLHGKQVSAYFWVLFGLTARANVMRYASTADESSPSPVQGARWRRFSQRTETALSQP